MDKKFLIQYKAILAVYFEYSDDFSSFEAVENSEPIFYIALKYDKAIKEFDYDIKRADGFIPQGSLIFESVEIAHRFLLKLDDLDLNFNIFFTQSDLLGEPI